MSELTTVEILRGAKTVLERNGWHRFDFYDHHQHTDNGVAMKECRVCLLGALNLAGGDHPVRMPDAAERAAVVLEGLVPDRNISAWNDTAGRTVADVFALLDEAIALAENTNITTGGTES